MHDAPTPVSTVIAVRNFGRDDVDGVVRMWRESFEHGVGVVDPHPIADQVAYFWREIAPTNRVRVAWQDERVVGVLAANAESVNLLYVRVGCHRQGLGRRLLQIAKAESAGSLWLYTFARNTNACAFYESQGFVVERRGFEPFWRLGDVRYVWTRGDA